MKNNLRIRIFRNQIIFTYFSSGFCSGKDLKGIDSEFIQYDEELKKSNLTDSQKKSLYQKQSMRRTKDKIICYANCNEWDYFLTLTFNPDKVDSYNYDLCVNKISNWLKYQKKSHSPNLRYLCVPELHKTGRWHFHLLVSNFNGKMTDSGKKDKKTGNKIYNLDKYSYGFTTAVKITDSPAVGYYLSKYITKEMMTVSENRKRYWVSYNLNTPTEYRALESGGIDEIITKINKCSKSGKIGHLKTVYRKYDDSIINYITVNASDIDLSTFNITQMVYN